MRRSLASLGLLSTLLTTMVGAQEDPFAAGVRPTPHLPPAEEQKLLEVPKGFEVQLVAAEPDILKPMNMAFDDRGRLWVSMSQEYPYAAPADREPRDCIKILEDTDGDGRAEKITTFADGLNIPIGLYPYQDGVVAFSIPYIWHLRDTDGDGVCDRRDKLYGPLGFERDTHGLNNAFRRGFDGWLYICHGFNNHTTVRGRDGSEITMQSGNTYRVRLDGSRVEQFTFGQVNPFGATFDTLGNLFTADCHSKPIYQLLRGGYYPSFGKPHDGLGFVPPMMDHLHGSTAICGLAYYTGMNFPDEYRGNMFSGNVMTSRVNRNSLIYHGSTIRAKEEPDFVISKDPWFRPVDIQLGPDGALYIADFYNRIIGHYEVPLTHPGRDRTSGRIWRVVYKGDDKDTRPHHSVPDLTKLSTDELISKLGDENATVRMLALNEIATTTDRRVIEALQHAFFNSENPHVRSHCLWAMHRAGGLRREILTRAVRDADREVRVHAMKVLSEEHFPIHVNVKGRPGGPRPEHTHAWQDGYFELVIHGLKDEDAFVRRAAADALGTHPLVDNIRPLLEALANAPAEDNHLIYGIRVALRETLKSGDNLARMAKLDLSESDSRALASICLAVKTPEAAAFLVNHIRQHDEPRGTLVSYLQHAARYIPEADAPALIALIREKVGNDVDLQISLLTPIQDGLDQRGVRRLDAMHAWAYDLAARLLNEIERHPPVWTNIPIAAKPDSPNPWGLQTRRASDGTDALFLTSLARGEQPTGILRSPTFEIPHKLSFDAVGHNGFPNQNPPPRNFIRLRDAETHKLLAEATPPRNDAAKRVEWNLAEHAGRRGYLELVDGDDRNGYAWLAVGRLTPEVVPLPQEDPVRTAERHAAIAALCGRFKLADYQPRLAKLVTTTTLDARSREALASALLSIDSNPSLAALLPVIGDPAVPASLCDKVCGVMASRDPGELRAALADAAKSTPARLQTRIAETLAGERSGAETLLALVAEGHASPRLLLNPNVSARLRAAGVPNLKDRLQALIAKLPSENEELRKLIDARHKAFAQAAASAEAGAAIFTKHCAACHQVAGKGQTIGPQLDGVGNRGLERIIEDILDPNRNVDVAFRTSTIVLTDGKVVTGLVRREEGETLVLANNEGEEFTIPKPEIDEHEKSHLSLMPANVPELIPEPDFHHLIAFLLAQRGTPPPAEGERGASAP